MTNDPNRPRRPLPARRSPWITWGGAAILLVILALVWTYWSRTTPPSATPSTTSQPAQP